MLRRRSLAKLLTITAIGAVAAFAWFSLPAPPRPPGEQAGHGRSATAAPAEGTVVAIDRAGKVVTISHGPLANLGMPPMTMGFRVDDAALLGGLKVGDKISFQPRVLDGAFVATDIERR